MKRFNWWKWSTVLLGMTLVLMTMLMMLMVRAATASERQWGLELISPELAATLQRTFPQSHVKSAQKAMEDGEKILRVRLTNSTPPLDVLAKVSLEGDILDLDEDMEKAQLPAHVEKAFRKAFPTAEIRHVEKGTRMEICYRLDVMQNGHKHEVKITRRGRIFEIESRD